MAQYTVEELDKLAADIAARRDAYEEIKNASTVIYKEVEALELKMSEALKELDRKSYESPIGRITLVQQWRYKLPQGDDKLAFFDYLKAKGIFENMASINHNTFNSFCKGEQEAADKEGKGFDFKLPGVEAPSLYETMQMRRK